MRNKLLAIVIFLIVLCHFSVHAGDELSDLNLQVDGSASVLKDDVAQAQEEAIKNALEKAIMQAAAKMLSEKFEDEKFQAVKSLMSGKADRYVKNYRLISEQRQNDDYTVQVHVVVAMAPVREDLLRTGLLHDQALKTGSSVRLTLTGIKKYSDFVRLKIFLQNQPKIVKSIYPCRLEWQQVQCDLVLTGSVRHLWLAIEQTGRYLPELSGKGSEINLRVKEEVQ